MLNFDTLELAWAAGFFDGEGSVCLRKRGGWRELWVQVPQSELTTLQRFQKAVGGLGKVYGPWQKNPRHLPYYRLDFYGYRDAQTVIALLWKFLSEPKRQQAYNCMISCRDYHQQKALHGKGPAKFTLAQVEDLRHRYEVVGRSRERVPKGWINAEATRLDVSRHTIAHILKGRGYGRPR